MRYDSGSNDHSSCYPSVPIVNFKDHYVLVFGLTSMQDANEKNHYPEIVADPLRLEVKFLFLLEHGIELLVLENDCVRLQLKSLEFLESIAEADNSSLQHQISGNSLLKCRYLDSIPSDYVPTFDNNTFAFVNTQTGTIFAKFCPKMYFAASLGRRKVPCSQKSLQAHDASTNAVPLQ